ncbi:sugar kinase [Umezawaea endophytica]|uniref:Sugar kinase n=1 Tax=Umezawaea endophytica TaxID=1654476 RepID=A0A9X2VWI6_9PSEU|nr:sugar kinase [Umezawaea endophytica]MCS7483964.1 sugar kinase [Umezawaea endophytica]
MTVDVLTFGETMAVLRATTPGPLRLARSLDLALAGAESTVAIGLSRLGHRARWVGRVGADEFGALVVERLLAERVDVVAHEDPAAPTGLLVREQRTADLARVAYYRAGSAGSRLSPDDLREPLRDGARVLLVSGITPALSDTARAATEAAVAHAVAHGWAVCLDVNHRSKLWTREEASDVLTPLAAVATTVFGDQSELDLVGGRESLLAKGVGDVVTKRGAEGAETTTPTGHWATSAAPTTVTDVIGAGDAFVAGYLSALLDGLGPAERLARGTAVAATAIATTGDWEGLPTRAELLTLHGETKR